jgi:hypothetical protein
MNNTIIVPLERIDEDDLEDLVKHVEGLTQADITISRQFVVTSDNPKVLEALGVLLGNGNGHTSRPVKKARKEKKAKASEMGARSWKDAETGEIISARTLKSMIAQGLVSEQAAFDNSKGERFVLIGGELVKEPSGEQA